jgi:hypothetical protein
MKQQITNNVGAILTNKTFDFSTSRKVKITINDVEKYLNMMSMRTLKNTFR